jgi:hypothetical protein
MGMEYASGHNQAIGLHLYLVPRLCLAHIYIRKISLLDMQLRWHAGRAVQIVVMLGWDDLQCTWSDARMLQPYCTRQVWCQGRHGRTRQERPGAPPPVGKSLQVKHTGRLTGCVRNMQGVTWKQAHIYILACILDYILDLPRKTILDLPLPTVRELQIHWNYDYIHYILACILDYTLVSEPTRQNVWSPTTLSTPPLDVLANKSRHAANMKAYICLTRLMLALPRSYSV